MGLDMYLTGDKYKRTEYDEDFNEINVQYVDGFPCKTQRLDLGYWRKHGPLHRFIVENYADGEDDCRPIHLNSDQLYEIAEAIREDKLVSNEDSHGFFFGNDEWWDELRKEREEHAQTFEKAAEWVSKGKNEEYWHSVEYCASW